MTMIDIIEKKKKGKDLKVYHNERRVFHFINGQYDWSSGVYGSKIYSPLKHRWGNRTRGDIEA